MRTCGRQHGHMTCLPPDEGPSGWETNTPFISSLPRAWRHCGSGWRLACPVSSMQPAVTSCWARSYGPSDTGCNSPSNRGQSCALRSTALKEALFPGTHSDGRKQGACAKWAQVLPDLPAGSQMWGTISLFHQACPTGAQRLTCLSSQPGLT